jgi:natural product precursor
MKLKLEDFTTAKLSPEEMNPVMGGQDLVAARPCKSGVDITATTGQDVDTAQADEDAD